MALFNLAPDSKLRACDLVALRVDDVALNGRVRSRATIMQRKKGRPVQFEVTEQTWEAVGRWLEQKELHKAAQGRAPVSESDQSSKADDNAPVRLPAGILAPCDWS